MQYPIHISFKILALAPQLYVTDAAGRAVGYVKQKLFKLKESVTVFTDETQATPIYQINADRVIDFSANYRIANAAGTALGSIGRKGWRSMWRAHYVISMADGQAFEIHEESAFVKFIDGLIGEIPVVGLFTGYFFNPIYLVSRLGSGEVLKVTKQRSFLESRFTIEQTGALGPQEQECLLLGIMMMILLERARG